MAALSAAGVGCDRVSGIADKHVLAAIAAAPADGPDRLTALQASANNADASPGVQAYAKAQLAGAQLAAARAEAVLAAPKAAAATALLGQIDLFRQSIANNNALVVAIQKRDPAAITTDLQTKAAEVNGGTGQADWLAGDKSNIPTLATLKDKIAGLQSQIAAKQQQVAQLMSQRQQAVQQADQLDQQSDQSQGQQAVDVYAQGAGKRKAASDLLNQIDQVNAAIVPLKHDLAIAQAQQAVLTDAAGHFASQSQALTDGWTNVQQQGQAVGTLSKQIAAGGDGEAAAAGSMQASAADFASTLKDYDAHASTARAQYEAAIKTYGQAIAAAAQGNTVLMQLVSGEKTSQLPEVAAWKAGEDVLAANVLKLKQAAAESGLADLLAERALLLTSQTQTAAAVTPALQGAGIAVPPELGDAQAAADAKTAVDEATAAFESASKLLGDIAQGAAPTPSAKDAVAAAGVQAMLLNYNWYQFARASGDTSNADQHLADAKAARDAYLAIDNHRPLPPVPDELASPAAAMPASAPAAG